jgi:predicted dinucleotide-binding enzyme
MHAHRMEVAGMRIGIIGSGRIGGTLARLFVGAGHEVAVSNSRGPDTLVDLVADIGEGARAMTAADAVAFGELLVVSVPFGRYLEVPTNDVAGKVVIDTNNYYPNRDGHYPELDEDRTTSSEMLQAHLKGARVVKAFNGINWEHLRDFPRPPRRPNRIGIPISGDDPEAKATVASLIDAIGFDAVDAGTLAEGGRKHQPGTDVYAADLRTSELREKLGV